MEAQEFANVEFWRGGPWGGRRAERLRILKARPLQPKAEALNFSDDLVRRPYRAGQLCIGGLALER